MEPILHTHHSRRKKNSARVNLTISIIIHAVLFGLGAYWAAYEGVLGKKLQELSVGLLPKDKKPEPKKEEPKTEEPKKIEPPKMVETAKTTAPPAPKFVPPPPAAVEATAPPPPVVFPGGFVLDSEAITSNDPLIHYKQSVEATLRSRWERPSGVDDAAFIAEVEVGLDVAGRITGHAWKKGSGDQRWDDSVRAALAATKAISRPPPKGFPEKFLVRFDVEVAKTEPVISVSAK